MLTSALNEPGVALPDRPAVTLSGGTLTGTKVGVPYAAVAQWILVTADTGVVVVAADADGLEVTATPPPTDPTSMR